MLGIEELDKNSQATPDTLKCGVKVFTCKTDLTINNWNVQMKAYSLTALCAPIIFEDEML